MKKLLIALIILIAILNVFNTNYNDIMSRRREMALLKAVGAEDGKIMRVIINQSILSIIMAAFFSLIISGGIIGVLHSIQKN